MKQIFGFFILVAVFVVAVKVAIGLLLLAGLIFRTKETIGVIAVLAVIAGFTAHPLIGLGMGAVLLTFSLYFKKKEKLAKADKNQLLLPFSDD